MPVTPTYPGVYIEEIPSGVRTIVGVATSVAAFIDFFRRGPMNRAVQIFSMADFEREFGGLDTRSEASYAIQQFFLNGGTEAWVVRTASGESPPATVLLLAKPGGDEVLRVSARDPGAWGNAIRVEIDYDTTDPESLFNLMVSEVAIQNGRPTVVRDETFRNLTMAARSNNAIQVVNEGSKLVRLSREDGWPLERPAPSGGTLGDSAVLTELQAVNADAPFNVDPGSGARQATLDLHTPVPSLQEVRTRLQAAIRAANPADPLLAGATVRLIGDRFHVLAGRGGTAVGSALTLTFSEFGTGTIVAALGLNVAANVSQYVLDGGQDGEPPDATALLGNPGAKTGLYALEDVDLFNILCVPRAADLDATAMSAVVGEAAGYCLERRAFLLLDVPSQIDTVQEARDWLEQNATLRHRNAALYFPRVRVADRLNNYRLRGLGASGTIAGLYARTDAARGVWKAPAGTEAVLRNVQELDYKLTDQENGALNPLGINCLRTFDVYGNVCWGARTLEGSDQQASEWKYVPVRRIALFIEESLYRGTQWVVFEPNDEPLWAQIRLNVGAFMHSLFRQGAFQGQSPREAYFVKCDKETTTQDDINRGIVNIVVGFAPLKPAEFVIIKIQQMAGQIQV
jgi:hypothetical protein